MSEDGHCSLGVKVQAVSWVLAGVLAKMGTGVLVKIGTAV